MSGPQSSHLLVRSDDDLLSQVISVPDLTTTEANNALRYLRTCYAPAGAINKSRDNAQVSQVLHLLGGRISLLLRAAKAPDMLGKSKSLPCVNSLPI